jgi:hypothetical protein
VLGCVVLPGVIRAKRFVCLNVRGWLAFISCWGIVYVVDVNKGDDFCVFLWVEIYVARVHACMPENVKHKRIESGCIFECVRCCCCHEFGLCLGTRGVVPAMTEVDPLHPLSVLGPLILVPIGSGCASESARVCLYAYAFAVYSHLPTIRIYN